MMTHISTEKFEKCMYENTVEKKSFLRVYHYTKRRLKWSKKKFIASRSFDIFFSPSKSARELN